MITRRRQVAFVAGTTALVALPLIVAVISLAGRRWYPVLDLAMTEFRVRDVGSVDSPLIGLPGRIGSLPDQGSHPGPISFWALAPGYWLFGRSAWALEASTVVLQLLWIGLAVWIGQRRAGTIGVVVVAAIIAVLIRGYGLSVLTQPWNPYLPLLAWIVVLLATWSVLCGDHLMLVPLVVAASFSAQTHIPYLTMAGGLGLIAIGTVLVRWWRSSADGDRTWRSVPGVVPLTVGVFFVLWLGALLDQLVRARGNLTRLVEHFGSPPESAIGLTAGLRLLLRHLDVVGGFGEMVTGDERFLQSGFDPDGAIGPGLLLLVVWLVAAVSSVGLRTRSLQMLHVVLAATLVLSLVSMSRIFGVRWFYLTLWAWGTATLMIVSIAWTGLAWWRQRGRSAPTRQHVFTVVAAMTCIVTVSMVFAAPSTEHPEEHLGETLGELVRPTEAAIREGVGAAEGEEGVYAVAWTDAYFFGSQAFGLVNELERAGLDARVYPNWRVPATSNRTVGPDPVTADVVFATGSFLERWRADAEVFEVANHEPRSRSERTRYDELRSVLIAELEADGLVDLVAEVDDNLFGVRIDQRLSDRAREAGAEMLLLGQETAVFIAPPGWSQR
jgi:hypothetical protein